MRAIGIAIPFFRRRSGVPIDAQAQVHFNRVIADGGVVPSGLSGVNAFFSAVKAIYGTSDINTAISAAYDAHYLGYKLGAGSGTTLGQAARTLYSVKSTENLLLQSEDFSNAYWVKNLGTITQNNTIAPDGTLTADLFTKTSGINTVSRVGRNTTFTTTGIHTLSIFVKPSVGNLIQLRLDVDGNTANSTFNFTTKTFTNSGANVISSSFQELPDGWFRLILTGNVLLTTWSVDVCLLFSNPTNDAMWLWGAQVNTGSVALPYTPTTTTTQTLADVVQTTAASQPLLLAHTGENYWFGSGVSGNYVSTPNAAINQITNDIELTAQVSLRWQSIAATDYDIIAKWSGAAEGYILRYNGSAKTLVLVTNLGGFTTYSSTATIASSNDTILWVRVTRQRSNGEVKFFTSTDGITYTQLGATVAGSTAAITVGSSVVEIGSRGAGTTASTIGKIYRATISNSIGGTPVVDFNPASYNPSVSQTQWSSATGEVWTINTGTATSGYKGVLVDRTIVQGDGVDDGIVTSGTITLASAFTLYGAFKGYNNEGGSGKSVFGKTNIDGSVFRNSITLLGGWIGSGGGSLTNQTADSTKLNLATFKRKVSSNTLQVNNGAVATNTASNPIAQSALSLFSVTTYGSSNALFTSGIISTLEDDTTQKTSMYNALKSYNNGAF